MGKEETIRETRAFGNGLIVLYILLTIGAMFGGFGLGWGILGVLIMAFLVYTITPAYPGVITLYNYLFFALLTVSIFAALLNLWSSFIPGLIVILGPFMVVGIPITHILYLIGKGREKKAAEKPKPSKKAEPKPSKKPKPSSTAKEAEESVLCRLGKKLALVCGYETLSAKKALGYLMSRTVLSWAAGSIVLALMAHFGVFG